MPDCIAPDYLPAAYNGVFFEGIVAGSEHGRRGVSGEFPFGEQTAYQDMGIKIRKYSITGHFQGPDCVTQTASLISAAETPGPGTLIHPTRGVLQVACTSLKVKDELIQGAGETNFDMEFVDAGSFATGLGSLPVIPIISGILTAVLNTFASDYTPQSVPFYSKTAVQVTTTQALNALATAFYQAIPANSNTTVYQTLYQMQSSAINNGTWVSAPATITAIQFAFAAIDTYASTAQIEYNVLQSLANTFAQTATARGVAGTCQEAIFSAMRTMCAAYMMRAATQIIQTTLEDALTQLDAIALIILEEKKNAIATGNDDLYIALAAFQSTALQTLTNYAYNLPPIVQYSFRGGIPSLVAAHEIYGDCTQNQVLETRNPFAFPYALGPVIFAVGQAA
jgi:prophage DNA circulation protein